MKTEDIRITQYALGELTGPAREAFEKAMAADPELLEEVRQTQQFCESIPTTLEPEAIFTAADREVLEKRIQGERREAAETKRRRLWSRLAVYGGLAAAACLLASMTIPAVTGSLQKSASVPLAKREPDGYVVALAPQTAATPAGLSAPEVRKPAEAQAGQEQLFASVAPERSSDQEKVRGELKRQLNEAPTFALSATTAPAAPAAAFRAASALAGNQAGNAQVAAPQSEALSVSSGFSGEKGQFIAENETRSRFVPSSPVDLDARHARPFRSAKARDFNTEGYDYQEDNRFLSARENPLSTFSVDVDTASYSNVRRFLQQENQLPPKGAVRVEELINYFPYAYPQPEGEDPFSVNVEVSQAPWNPQHELVRIGLKGREIAADQRPASNLVFLIDVSGSMNTPAKLPLLQKSLTELAARLGAKDRVAIVVYAGSSGLVLPSTADKAAIREALERLRAGGSTNGADGIKLAYREARENFLEDGNNRVILCTDGDFNVGVTNEQALIDLIEKERKSGVFLSVLGFGAGNLKDSQMEKLADKGNGNYAYIDSIAEGRKVLGEQMGATLFTIAKDVKLQVEFNPATVAGYRLIGYENRVLAKEDFNNDKKDAGEIGAGHAVTAFYEVVPAGQPLPDADSVDALKYQQPAKVDGGPDKELLTVKLRYKQPDGDTSKLLEVPVANDVKEWSAASEDFRFAAAVAAFGQKLRGSKTLKNFDWPAIQKLARPNLGDDPGSYRAEFLTLVEKARQIDENP